jgi:lysophospholipase L1-like esterase
MSRLTGPSEATRLVYRTAPDRLPLTSAAGMQVTVYAEETGPVLADIQTTTGASIAGAVLTADANSMLPDFLLPDGVDTVWADVGGSTRFPVNASEDDRLDELEGDVAVVQGKITSLEEDVIELQGDVVSLQATTYGMTGLERWYAKLASDPGAVKINMIGDSTSDPTTDAVEIRTRLRTAHTLPGEGLEGVATANITSRGRNGKSVAEWIANTAWVDEVVADDPDLLIVSLGINDIRLGLTSTATLAANLESFVETLISRMPDADIVLRTPNSFLSDDTAATGFVSPVASAQAYSTALREVYAGLKNRWPHVVVWNAQDRLFGRVSRTLANSLGLMKDIIHPSRIIGYHLLADRMVHDVIAPASLRPFTSPAPVEMVPASRAAYPYLFGDIVNRADSAVAPGTPSSGQTYTTAGTVGVSSGTLYAPGAGLNRVLVDLGRTDYELGATLMNTPVGVDQYLMFRYVDNLNFWFLRATVGYYLLSKIVAGVVTDGTIPAGAPIPAKGDRIRMFCRGAEMYVSINDKLLTVTTAAEHTTGQKIGIQLPHTTARYTDLWARALTPR